MDAISYRPMTTADLGAVKELMASQFIGNEPLLSLLSDDTTRDANTWFEGPCKTCLDDGLSVVAVHNSTRQIIGFRLSVVVHKDNPNAMSFSRDDPKTRALAEVWNIVFQLYKSVDIFTKYNVDKFVSFRGLCVHGDYRQNGIATQLVYKALELIKENKFKVITVECTSDYSRRVFLKLGFETLSEIAYKDVTYYGERLKMTPNLQLHGKQSLHAKVL